MKRFLATAILALATALGGTSQSNPQSGPTLPGVAKTDEGFQAEWDKLKKENPQEFERQKAQFLVMAQMYLGEFGYGTVITSNLDERTAAALREYQARSGLPPTGDINPQTVDQLIADDKALNESDLFLPDFQFLADAWDAGVLSAGGSWVGEGNSNPDIETSSIACYRDWGLCIDGQALQAQGFGYRSTNIVSKFEAYKIKQWDKFQIIADLTHDTPCERDTLYIIRQEKSVTVVSSPAYRDEKQCEKLYGSPKTVISRLQDGKSIYAPRNKANQAARRRILQMTEAASRTIGRSAP
jgi:hypothetical protein